MALPDARETERGRYLQNILDATVESEWVEWPSPTKDDFALVGAIIVICSYVDFNLRRLLEVCDHVEMVPQHKGKIGNMNAAEVAKAVQALPIWDANAKQNLSVLEEIRKMRNLMAHFVIRRFPIDGAFMFTAKSSRDYKKVFGREPSLGMSLTAVVDLAQVREGLHVLEDLQIRLANTTADLERKFLELKPYGQV